VRAASKRRLTEARMIVDRDCDSSCGKSYEDLSLEPPEDLRGAASAVAKTGSSIGQSPDTLGALNPGEHIRNQGWDLTQGL